MSENLRTYTKALYAMDAVVRRVPDDAWDNQSPNPEWTARATLGHVMWSIERLISGANDSAPPEEKPEAEVAGPDPVGSWTAALDSILEALDQQGILQKVIWTPFGEMPVDQAIGFFFSDTLTHTWDVAVATGVDPVLPESLTGKALGMLQGVSEMLRGPGVMADPVEVSEDTDLQEAFVAFTGRDPSWSNR